jgi:predicted nucleic acid-binding protein
VRSMGERRIFLDTSGIFAWINARDQHHELMLSLPRQAGVKLFVTDYIIDEACTLFVARNIARRRDGILQLIRHSRIVRMEWVGQDVFWQAWEWQRKFHDQPFSFTDCTSFAVMKKLGLSEVATNDAHFQTAGFQPLLLSVA